MTTKLVTFWDLTEKDRAALTEADVERYIDAELMTKGVLRAKLPALDPEPEMPAPDVTIYTVGSTYGTRIAYTTSEAAARAAEGVTVLHSDYINGQLVQTVDLEREGVTVKSEPAYSKGRLAECRAVIERVTAVKAANKKKSELHKDAQKKEREALEGLWENWHECRSKAVEMQAVVDTLADYTRIAGGDEDIALSFLAKAYDWNTLKEAAEWHGRSFEAPSRTGEAPPEPEPQRAEPAEEIAF